MEKNKRKNDRKMERILTRGSEWYCIHRDGWEWLQEQSRGTVQEDQECLFEKVTSLTGLCRPRQKGEGRKGVGW